MQSTTTAPAGDTPATTPAPIVDVDSLTHTYHGSTPREVLRELSFSVREGEFVCVVGPSGCGKTTLLRLLSGLMVPTGGAVRVNGQRLDAPHRDVAVVFQDYARALCAWRSAVRNVELPMEAAGVPRRERRERALGAMERVGLEGHETDYPRQMSGGMQQRLQIARALAQRPRILLMDEPFASVDALTRFHLEDTTLQLWRDLDQTLILVTHDLDEAVYLADRIIVLESKPARVAKQVAVDLPRPRDQAETRALPRFSQVRHDLFEQIRAIEERTA